MFGKKKKITSIFVASGCMVWDVLCSTRLLGTDTWPRRPSPTGGPDPTRSMRPSAGVTFHVKEAPPPPPSHRLPVPKVQFLRLHVEPELQLGDGLDLPCLVAIPVQGRRWSVDWSGGPGAGKGGWQRTVVDTTRSVHFWSPDTKF